MSQVLQYSELLLFQLQSQLQLFFPGSEIHKFLQIPAYLHISEAIFHILSIIKHHKKMGKLVFLKMEKYPLGEQVIIFCQLDVANNIYNQGPAQEILKMQNAVTFFLLKERKTKKVTSSCLSVTPDAL